MRLIIAGGVQRTPPPTPVFIWKKTQGVQESLGVTTDELGQPVKGMIYKTPPAGNQDALHQADGKTDGYGETFIVTTEENESIDFHLVWRDLETDKNTDEG